jgi:hypothetical protein
MGHIVRAQRKGNGNVFRAHTHHRKGAAKFRPVDAAERSSQVTGVVKQLLHDPGYWIPGTLSSSSWTNIPELRVAFHSTLVISHGDAIGS